MRPACCCCGAVPLLCFVAVGVGVDARALAAAAPREGRQHCTILCFCWLSTEKYIVHCISLKTRLWHYRSPGRFADVCAHVHVYRCLQLLHVFRFGKAVCMTKRLWMHTFYSSPSPTPRQRLHRPRALRDLPPRRRALHIRKSLWRRAPPQSTAQVKRVSSPAARTRACAMARPFTSGAAPTGPCYTSTRNVTVARGGACTTAPRSGPAQLVVWGLRQSLLGRPTTVTTYQPGGGPPTAPAYGYSTGGNGWEGGDGWDDRDASPSGQPHVPLRLRYHHLSPRGGRFSLRSHPAPD